MEELKLTEFSEADYNQFLEDYKHDKQLDEDAKGCGVDINDYVFKLNPQTFGALVTVNVNEMSYDDKVRFIKLCLDCDCLSNVSIISNLVVLAQGRLIDEELYEKDDVFFEDDIEFLDICTDLREEIKAFNTKLVSYFLGAFKSMSNLIGDGAVHVPNLYYNALSTYSLRAMSSAMQKVSVNYDELPIVLNGEAIVEKVCVKKSAVSEFIDELCKAIPKDEIVKEG